MAGDVASEPDCFNPCCVELKKRYLKMQKSRDYSRQAVKILEDQLNKVLKEKEDLKKAYEEQQVHGKQDKEAMNKESSIRNKLEKEICDLKAEISSYQKRECLKSVDDYEIQVLKGRILEAQEETNKLKGLLEKERRKYDSEMKKSALEKKKAAEIRELVLLEKKKLEEARRLSELEKRKADESRICLENLKREANGLREKLAAALSRAQDARKEIEAENLKSIREKKRIDTEIVKKAEHQKRLMEVELEKAAKEKARADHLSQMLEEEKQRREELEKKIEEVVSKANVQYGSHIQSERCSGEITNVKLLRQQLRLERKQAKYANKVAKQEKAKKRFIMQELHLIKHSFMQTFCHFNMLNNHLLENNEGIDGEAKIGKSSKFEGFELCENLFSSKRDNLNSRIDFGLTGTCCTGFFKCTESAGQGVGLPTGTISQLESPVGVSVKNKSPRFAVCSNTSFSDEKSMGSQERNFIAVTTSDIKKFSDQRSNVQELPCEVAKVKKDKGVGVVVNNMDNGQKERQNVCLITSTHGVMGVADPAAAKLKNYAIQRPSVPHLLSEEAKVRKEKRTEVVITNRDGSGQSKVQNTRLIRVTPELDYPSKRRKIQGTVKPVECTSTKINQMHMVEKLPSQKSLDGCLSVAKCSSLRGISKDLDSKLGFLNEMQDDPSRNVLAIEKQTPDLQCLGQSGNQEQTGKFDTQRRQCGVAETTFSSHQVSGNVCIKEAVNTFSNEGTDLLSFENMISGNYMKLLDLDNVVDEERYKMAVAMPLSPTLPDIELPNHHSYWEDDSHYSMGRGNSMPNQFSNVMDLEVCCNNSKLETSIAPCGSFSHENLGVLYPGEMLTHSDATDLDLIEKPIECDGKSPGGAHFPERRKSDDDKFSAGKTKPGSINQSFKGSTQISPSSCSNIDLSGAEVEDCTPPYAVVFSDMKGKDCMTRILHSRNKFTHPNFMVSQTNHGVVEVLNALSTETTLLPKEKICVLFSILMGNISSRIIATSKCTTYDLLSCLECFAPEINSVMSMEETRSFFEETCEVDILVSLTEDFLIEREVLMCTDVRYESQCPFGSSCNLFEVDGVKLSVFPRDATVDQFLAGCVVLASISAAIDQIGILLEVSYKVLRSCKTSIPWTLLALHAFASVCGKGFFDMSGYCLLIAVIRSVVLLLERGDKALASISPCLYSSSYVPHSFPACKDCPFAIGAICIDELTDLLLEVLQGICMTGVGNPNVYESSTFPIRTASACTARDEQNTDNRSKLDNMLSCTEHSCVFSSRDLTADMPHCFSRRQFCQFTDIVSLLELIASYMSWEWICNRVMPRLSNMFESCQSGDLLAVLFLLTGQLARFGADKGGYQQMGIAEVRCSLSLNLDICIVKERSLFTQVAAVAALLNLLPFTFGDVVGDSHELSPDTSLSIHVKQLKKWFSQLSKHRQSESIYLLDDFVGKMMSLN